MSAETVVDILGYATTVAFTALALLSLRNWEHRRDRPSLWASLCFSALAIVSLAGFVVPEDPGSVVEQVEARARIVVVVLFPYFLYRFAASFDPPSARTDRLAAGATAALIVWTVFLPEIPGEEEPRSFGLTLYVAALVSAWAALSLLVAVRLWQAGKGQPSVARHRMRLLAGAATVLTLALSLAAADEQTLAFEISTSLLAVTSAVLFAIGLSPPTALRLVWRRPETERIRDAMQRLIAATTPEEVTADALPAMAGTVGARALFLVDEDGGVIGTYGADAEELKTLAPDDPSVVRIDTAGGDLVVVTNAYAPFFGSDELELLRSLGALIGIALDRSRLYVQERDARLELERADEMKSSFIALAAHELRTPVTSIHGVVTTLDRIGDQLTDSDREELREALRSQSDRMRRLVEQLLDLSRLDAAHVPIQPVAVSVRAELEELVAEAAGDRAREVEVDVPADLRVRIDRAVFERTVSNLLTNALRHGAPPVRITAAQNDRHFRLAVEDHGPGVPAEFVGDLFERFSRSDDARARGLGSGLGLAIARSYAQAHGGDLVYEPGKPRGARFELVIPHDGVSAARE